jgi:hypothetical protein
MSNVPFRWGMLADDGDRFGSLLVDVTGLALAKRGIEHAHRCGVHQRSLVSCGC